MNVTINDQRAGILDEFLSTNCPQLVRRAKEMLHNECIIADNAFLADPEDKKIFDRWFKYSVGINWDAVAVMQTKSQDFMKTVVNRDVSVFKKAVSIAEKLVKNFKYMILAPGRISLDFMSHMATGFEWRNGLIRPIENFTADCMHLITPALPKKDPQDAVVSYAFYIVKSGSKSSLLLRRVSNNPARSMVWVNMLSHKSLLQYSCGEAHKHMVPGPLTEMVESNLGDCNLMLEPGNFRIERDNLGECGVMIESGK